MPSDAAPAADPDVLAPGIHAAILAEIIADFLDPMPPAQAPRCYLLGGQPGAGKTGLRKVIEAALGDAKPLVVDPDELRIYHPDYVGFVEHDPLTAATRTHPDASAWADELRMAALARGVNVIVDGTLRSPDWAVQMAVDAAERGYGVEVHAVAVPLDVSRQGVRGRLEESFAAQRDESVPPEERPLPRSVPDGIQQGAYDGLPDSLAALSRSGVVSRIRVARRDGTAVSDVAGADDVAAVGEAAPNRFAEALMAERSRPWSGPEIAAYQTRGQTIMAHMTDRLARTEGPEADALADELARVRDETAAVTRNQARRSLATARAQWVRRVLGIDVTIRPG